MVKTIDTTSTVTGSYCYDQAGNMNRRTIGSSTYNLTYDANQQLTGVTGAAGASMVYDGDGHRVRSVLGGVTTVSPNDLVEWSGTTLTKYYYADGQRIAMRKGSTLTFLLSDHLGSAAVALDTNGTIVVESSYALPEEWLWT